MDRAEALVKLPQAYSLALRLHERGVDRDLIAECLGIDAEAVTPLLALAQAKLTAIERVYNGTEPA